MIFFVTFKENTPFTNLIIFKYGTKFQKNVNF